MPTAPVETMSSVAWARRDLNGRQAILVAGIAMATLTGLDLADDGQLGFVFSLGFVLIVITVALGVDLDSLFQAGVFPPMLLIGTLGVVTLFWPDAIHVNGMAKDAGAVARLIAATIDHGMTLVVGHGLALVLIALRITTAPDK